VAHELSRVSCLGATRRGECTTSIGESKSIESSEHSLYLNSRCWNVGLRRLAARPWHQKHWHRQWHPSRPAPDFCLTDFFLFVARRNSEGFAPRPRCKSFVAQRLWSCSRAKRSEFRLGGGGKIRPR
jgi:hypothetical protein